MFWDIMAVAISVREDYQETLPRRVRQTVKRAVRENVPPVMTGIIILQTTLIYVCLSIILLPTGQKSPIRLSRIRIIARRSGKNGFRQEPHHQEPQPHASILTAAPHIQMQTGMLRAKSAKPDMYWKTTDAFQNAPFYHPAAVILYPTSNPVLTATGVTFRPGASRAITYSAATVTVKYRDIHAKKGSRTAQTITWGQPVGPVKADIR